MDERSVDPEAGTLGELEHLPAPAEEAVERVEPWRAVITFDPGHRRLGNPGEVGQLPLRECRLVPSLPKDRPCSHGFR